MKTLAAVKKEEIKNIKIGGNDTDYKSLKAMIKSLHEDGYNKKEIWRLFPGLSHGKLDYLYYKVIA